MSQEIGWDTILNKLNNHSYIDQTIEEDKSEPVFIPPYHQFQMENLEENSKEVRIVEKNLFTVNQFFMVTRTQNLNTLKIQSLQNINIITDFTEHIYQIADTKFYDYNNLCGSCDISGLILVWKVNIENNKIKTQIVMKGKFEDNLCSNLQIEWKNSSTLCTFNQNEISLWTFSEDNQTNQSKGPLHFQTQVFDGNKIQKVKFSKYTPIVYYSNLYSIIIMNSVYFNKIKEFKPYKKDKIQNIFIFKRNKQQNRDILITLSQKGILKVWDIMSWIEEKKKFFLIQKISIQNQTLSYKKTVKEDMIIFSDFDLDQNLFFVLSCQQKFFILQVFQVDQSFHTDLQDMLDISVVQKKLFLKQLRFQIPGTNINQLQITQILESQQDLYFLSDCEIQQYENLPEKRQKIKDLVYTIYTVNTNNINVNFIQGESFSEQIENNLKDTQQVQQDQNQKSYEEEKQEIQVKNVEIQKEQQQINQKSSDNSQRKQKKQKSQKNLDQKQRERSNSYFKQEDEKIVNQIKDKQKDNQKQYNFQKEDFKDNQEIIQKDNIQKDNIQKESIQKESIQKDNVQKNIIQKNNVQKDNIQKENFQKNNIQKDQKINKKKDFKNEIQQENNDAEQIQQLDDQIQSSQFQENFSQNYKESIETYISLKLNSIFQDNNYTQQIENQIKQQIENTMKREFQVNFQDQITPIFEKYLENIFKQAVNTFDQGKDYYMDKISNEKQKYQNLEEQMEESLKFFSKQSQVFQQFTESSIQNFNQIENKIRERENTVQQLMEQMQFLQKNNNEQNQKLIDLEKQLYKVSYKKNEDEQDQTINSQLNSNIQKSQNGIYIQKKDQFLMSQYNQSKQNDRQYNQRRQDEPAINNLLYAIDNFKGYVQNQQYQQPNYYQGQDLQRQNQSFIDKFPQENKNYFQYDQNKY